MADYISMGVPTNLNDPSLEFMRPFRWLISSQHLAATFNTKVEIDWHDHTVAITAMEIATKTCEMPISEWADGLRQNLWVDEKLTLTEVDGCGRTVRTTEFNNLQVVGENTRYNYEDSGILCRTVTVRFDNRKQSWIEFGDQINAADFKVLIHVFQQISSDGFAEFEFSIEREIECQHE